MADVRRGPLIQNQVRRKYADLSDSYRTPQRLLDILPVPANIGRGASVPLINRRPYSQVEQTLNFILRAPVASLPFFGSAQDPAFARKALAQDYNDATWLFGAPFIPFYGKALDVHQPRSRTAQDYQQDSWSLYAPLAQVAPFAQYDWPTPARAKTAQDYVESMWIPYVPAPQPPFFGSAQEPVQTRPKLVQDFQDQTWLFGAPFIPFFGSAQDVHAPRPKIAQDFTSDAWNLFAPIATVPFSQSDWPLASVRARMADGYTQYSIQLYIPPPQAMPFNQFDWITPQPSVKYGRPDFTYGPNPDTIPPYVPPLPPEGGGGGTGGSWGPKWPQSRWGRTGEDKKVRKLLDDVAAEVMYRDLIETPDAAKAAKLVKPYAETKKVAIPRPEVINWEAVEMDAARVGQLFSLWRKRELDREIEDDDDDVIFMMWD